MERAYFIELYHKTSSILNTWRYVKAFLRFGLLAVLLALDFSVYISGLSCSLSLCPVLEILWLENSAYLAECTMSPLTTEVLRAS